MFSRLMVILCCVCTALVYSGCCRSCSARAQLASEENAISAQAQFPQQLNNSHNKTIKRHIIANNTLADIGYNQEENSTLGFIKNIYNSW